MNIQFIYTIIETVLIIFPTGEKSPLDRSLGYISIIYPDELNSYSVWINYYKMDIVSNNETDF